MPQTNFSLGSIVKARGREWIVQPGTTADELHLRPLSGAASDECVILPDLELEPPASATFALPDPDAPGNFAQAQLLKDALQMKLRNGAGPFRSFGNIAVEPRSYQLVPLLMALRQDVTRLLISDDVGIGKTIEAGLVLRELYDRGEVSRAVILCPPHLVDQWVAELDRHFHLKAEALTGRTVRRLERDVGSDETIFTRYPFVVVSLDYIKSERHRDHFIHTAPDCVIVDEAHTCAYGGTGLQYRYDLLKKLAARPERHLILLTATPHSGDRDCFYNLLALLKSEFHDLMDVRADDKALRDELARHFVQRRRIDIESAWGGEKIFPRRLTRECPYELTPQWTHFLQRIYDFCRALADRPDVSENQRRFNGYTALALLRCASSSPAAAIKTFATRLKNAPEEPAAVEPGDDDVDGEEATSDLEPDLSSVAADDVKALRELAKEAQKLKGADDPKLRALVDLLRQQYFAGRDRFHPVVFCRFVETAKYVEEHLKAAFAADGIAVKAVTGEIPADAREQVVAELAQNEKRILVATDCLSEGINLQRDYDGIIHYDLVWNPTRHEQREGRVDRYGQPRGEVRCALLYGKDNPVDGIVFNVIIKKAQAIRQELGVAVPVPTNDANVRAAMLQAMRLKHVPDANQMDFFDQLFHDAPEMRAMDNVWNDAADRERRNRTKFAQNALKPEDVAPELAKANGVLGAAEDVARFVTLAVRSLGASLEPQPNKPGICRFHPQHLPEALKTRLADAGFSPRECKVAFDQKAADGAPDVLFVPRSHPLVTTLADYVLESALGEPAPGMALAPARCAVVRTRDVAKKTVLAVLRLRHRLTHRRAEREETLIGEEVVSLMAEGSAAYRLMSGAETAHLFTAVPSSDLASAATANQIRTALDGYAGATADVERIARERAQALLDDHCRVRKAAKDKGSHAVKAVLPVDLMGLYVFLPEL